MKCNVKTNMKSCIAVYLVLLLKFMTFLVDILYCVHPVNVYL